MTGVARHGPVCPSEGELAVVVRERGGTPDSGCVARPAICRETSRYVGRICRGCELRSVARIAVCGR
jgi:hypothetical protein